MSNPEADRPLTESDSDSDGEVGASAPPLTKQISNILNRYPEGGQILKELIQNADDAQASNVGFLIDWRDDHPRDRSDIMFDNFEEFQGPALYAWNDAVFKENDWTSLGKINQSSKEEDVLKVGRFGLGFQSVFHITDLPMVVSQKHIAIIDPHRKCVKPKSETSPAGTKKRLSKLFKHAGHISTFESIFGLSTEDFETYNGTIFRFPLRQPNSDSKISTTSYTPEKIQTTLFESLMEESPYILLFLRSVKSISLMEWKKGSPQPQETFRVAASDQEVSEAPLSLNPSIEHVARQFSQSSEDGDSEVCVELKSMTVTISRYNHFTDSEREGSANCHHWLVLKVVGTNDSDLDKLGKELSIFPWVGVATEFPRQIALCECTARTPLPFNDHNTVEHMFKELEGNLKRSQISMSWPSEPVSNAAGHAYCFLPLPETTAMPVHVHGYFAVTDNRRSIKWPMHDEKGKEAQWNKDLLYKMVAPAYSLLLSCRASLIHYEGTPLPIANTEHVTADAYSMWPLYPDVKNAPIWQELLSPTMSFSSSLPLLWTSACGGKWVQFSEAYYLPGSFTECTYNCSRVVIQMLVKLDIPVVGLSTSVCETIKQNEKLMELVKGKEISPQFVREMISKNFHYCSSLPKKDVYEMLEFVLSDLNHSNYHLLNEIPLLPLKGAAGVVMFQRPASSHTKYVFPSNSLSLLDVVPGADSLIVEPELPETIARQLCEIASTGCLQLKVVDTEAMCKQLLPKSVYSWCSMKSGAGWQWLPGHDPYPSQSWMDALWAWIAETKTSLSALEGLPIIPQLIDYQSNEVALLKVSKGTKMCRVSATFSPRESAILTCILKKLGILIVDGAKMNDCNKMKQHPDFECYVPELRPKLELIVEYLDNLHVSSRLQTVQQLDNSEKDFLRKQLYNLYESCVQYQDCLQSIPIYIAACSTELSPTFISLSSIGGVNLKAFLPPDNIPPLSDHPRNMLCPATSPEEKKFLQALAVRQLSLSDLCTDHLIPLALQHIHGHPNSWSIGDDLILWILKQQQQDTVLHKLSQHKVIYTRYGTHKLPQNIYDPQDQTLTTLFDIESDRDKFPDERYVQESHYRQALRKLGIKTWKDFQNNHEPMYTMLHDRMNSVRTLKPSVQMSRGQFIVQTLADPNNYNFQQDGSLNGIQFLKAEACLPSYPSCLKGMWCGQSDRLYSISELSSPDGQAHNLVGTAMPILSSDYCHGQYAVQMSAFQRLAFQKHSVTLVMRHLENIQSIVAPGNDKDIDSFDQIVMAVYEYLHVNTSGVKLPLIWWRVAESPQFLPASKFVLDPPEGYPMSLEPFYHCLRLPMRKYANLFQLHDPLTPATMAEVVRVISKHGGGILSSHDVKLCVSILNWLCEKDHKETGMLMITEKDELIPAMECVYDDRDWMKHSKSHGHIKGKSLQFVHDQIPQKVAKHFEVVPLSCKVAPSQKLKISYVQTGQYEDITQRIQRIVQDYPTEIDIFKELIQNADDAEASEVKFLIDWREHPKDSLLSEELKEWQGPALIVYNNATFSDEDFNNICKVAGETKKQNPLKTGRFGVGFCAMYHLTDLPSFISRRFFTIFDPHTSYLKDRITTQQPGMRVDLVKHQADLELLQGQFKPYESIFGCDVFNLSGDGYQGTIFRFPFRSECTSTKSKICTTIYNRGLVSNLVHSLKMQGEKLLLFLKHVNKVTVYKLERGNNPSAPCELFSVERTLSGGTMERVSLIKNYGFATYPIERSCSDKFSITVQDSGKPSVETHWMVSSAIKSPSGSYTNLQRKLEAVGLLSLAEVAIRLDPAKEDPSFNVPSTSYDMGKVFCFLPLPIESKLPFHVNGFFSIGKDRRNVLATDDRTFGSLWNKSLVEGALVAAFITLLQNLTREINLQCLSNPNVKQEYLDHYYLLWKVKDATGPIGATFAAAFKDCIPNVMHSILWSEKSGGCWLSPVSVVVFKDGRLKQKDAKQTIEKDAISILLSNGYGVVDLPSNVYEILKTSLAKGKREYNYEKFCKDIFFPRICMIDQSIRDRHILFLLERIGEYHGTTMWYNWAENFLKDSPCIRCQHTNTIRPACQLISPSNGLFKNLYDVSEGRFPNENFQKSSNAMEGLSKLGMASSKLKFSDFKERAESITRLQHELALERSKHFCEYIDSAYGPKYYYGTVTLNLNEQDKWELQQLLNIPFLTVKQKPHDVNVPWCGMARQFDSPSRVYSSDSEHLVFSQHPVVELDSKKLLQMLGINSRQPTPEVVIAHLRCIIRHINSDPNDPTVQFLNSSMKEVYRYLERNLSSPQLVSSLMQLQKFIWQESCFLGPNQVLRHWQQKCIPYMCELSSENMNFMRLWSVLGVREEATLEVLVDVLQRIASDHGIHIPVSDEILKFITFIAGELHHKLNSVHGSMKDHSLKIYLPDKNRIMRTVSELADNVSKDWVKSSSVYQDFLRSGSGYFVHESIHRDHAVSLGVKPLLEAVVKEFEDESFLEGTDFGQEEELCDRLNGILKKYPANASIFKEFIQNADDAQATEIIFVLDHRIKFSDSKLLSTKESWKSLQKTPALCIFNNRKFTEADIEGITKLGKGSKSSSAELIGKFGIGFNVAYHVTDCPSFVSYSENGTPEYLCVFDPTRSYVQQAAKHSPGRKWNFKGKEDQYSEFSEQFEPYLAEDLNHLAEQTPHCLQDFKSHGYVVFRLPLTRSYGRMTSRKLSSGHRFDTTGISNLFKEFATDSQDLLLFLNHLRSVSAFEIKENGSFLHHFTTTACVPPQDLKKHEKFSTHVKQSSRALCTRGVVESMSLTHRMNVTCIQPDKEESENLWLVQRMIGGNGLPKELLRAGLEQGLRPIGGVATLIKPLSNYKYRLFCFLPLPFQSTLPAHINGHFWIDDSRKHLESSMHKGLESWNISIAQKVIVPAYLDLIMEAKNLLDTTDKSKWFYSLFPRRDEPDAESEGSKVANVGELTNLNIVHFFYNELLQRNLSVFIRQMPQPSPNTTVTWMAMTSCLFSVPFVSEKTCNQLSVSEELRSALVALGMPVTIAPNYIHEECSLIDSKFKSSAIIHPDKIVDHLQRLVCSEEHKKTIKKYIQPILQYCISGYPPCTVRSLFEKALYLVAKDGSLQRGCLFGSYFSELLPHCSNRFIDPELEMSSVGMKLQDVMSYNVICALPLEFVASNIQLSTTNAACSINQSNMRILNLLWAYIAQHPLTISSISEKLKNLFHSKPIIPANDGQVYPLSMSKMLVRDTAGQCDQCTIMKRLGYPQIDFEKIEVKDPTRKQLSIVINDLTSCFIEGQEIIDCFLLQPPNIFDIQLSNDEAQCFLNSLVKQKSPQSLGQISTYLLKMPLFQTIDGSRITLHGVNRVFILLESSSDSGVPFDGVTTSSNAQVVLKTSNSELLKRFYDAVIPADKKVYVGSEEFYVQIVLPILPTLEDSCVKKHVEYLHLHKDAMTNAFNCLKETPFISHNGKKYKVKELCDHRNKFFATFKQEYILPVQWRGAMVVMENLDLQMSVTTTEWLNYARKFSTELGSRVEHKSSVLFDQLTEIIHRNEDLITFLRAVSDIQFIYSAEKWELNQILSRMFPVGKQGTTLTNNMVKFRESVSFHEANNACLCRSVLPEHCEGIINNSSLRKALFIESPITPTIVAENLLCLCKRMSASCARTQSVNQEYVTKLIQILEGHYAVLNTRTPQTEAIARLRDAMCILPKQTNLLQLVKPSQLVVQLPPDCFLEPYCYKVERWLQMYGVFLTSIGVRQELTAQDYVEILQHVKKGIEDNSGIHDAGSEDNVGLDDKERKVIESAYKELIRRLRQGDTIRNNTEIYLPDEELNLTEVNDLYLNDVPWYRSRLPSDCDFKFILQPPADSERNRTLPEVLKVKWLSNIVTETLTDSCKGPDFKCTYEELVAAKKRTIDDRCVFVKNILETLNSDQLFEGFCRMYYTQYKSPPPDSFKQSIKKLNKVQVYCVKTDLKSVLHFRGKPISGTEDTSKLCHLSHDSDGMASLYISPHKKSVEEGELSPFFKDLAVCIGKLIDNVIANMVPIAAVFECCPREIPMALTREQVHEYSEEDFKPTKASTIGTAVPWSRFPPQESLIVLNFEPKDRVRYLDDSGLLINAEIVQVRNERIQNMEITVKVKEVDAKKNEDEDIVATDGRSADDMPLIVSPMRVFKVLDKHQQRSLWSESASPLNFARPIVLETVPSENSAELKQWLDIIYDSLVFTSHSELIQSVFTLRLLGHIHYQLVTQKKNHTLFIEAAFLLQDKFHGLPHTNEYTHKIDILLENIIKSETTGPVSSSIKLIFPSKELEQIIKYSDTTIQTVLMMNNQGPSSIAQQPVLGGICAPLHGNQPQVTPASNRYTSPRSASTRRTTPNPRYPPQAASQQLPPPNTCTASATAWLDQAKADYNAAKTLLCASVITLNTARADSDTDAPECKFPALVCFLCHDTVEKTIKGVLYAFCGLRQDLVNSSNLVMLKEALALSPHHPKHLLDPINECVNTINKHENMSRFPNYRQYPPCAPASTYYTSDAKEAFSAITKLLHLLQSEVKLNEVLKDLGQLPTKRFMSSLQSLPDDQGFPQNWDPMKDEDEVKLCLLDPEKENEEYERVTNQFLLTLPRAHILRVERVQNKHLWKRYQDCSKRMSDRNFYIRDELLFHGTSGTNPEDIYRGTDSFDLRCSAGGMWGRGIYFAVNASYSDGYAYCKNNIRRMFAAHVLTGNSFFSQSDRSLTKPPPLASSDGSDTSAQHRYDSVCGNTGGTRVYITYDNDHAYPAYLITYTN